jgi:hypothetical protein
MKPNINNANLRDCRTSILPIVRPFALRQLAKYDVPLLRKAWLKGAEIPTKGCWKSSFEKVEEIFQGTSITPNSGRIRELYRPQERQTWFSLTVVPDS